MLVVECKAETKDHASAAVLNPIQFVEDPADYVRRIVQFAADGVLHYARALSRDYNVIAVAVSGQTESAMQVSAYLHSRGSSQPKLLTTKGGMAIRSVIPWSDYIEHATFDPAVQAVRLNDLMEFSHDLHDFMRDDVKASESEKPLFVSGTLIALRNKAFSKSYDDHCIEVLWNGSVLLIGNEQGRHTQLQASDHDYALRQYSSTSGASEISQKIPKGGAERTYQTTK